MLQHQIAHSPARLGLTSPNSPSLQSPPPPQPSKFSAPPPQPAQPHPVLSAPPASSALLSLLPPLPRAQSLLLQMASLSTRLFEISPNRSLLTASFRGTPPTFLPSQPPSTSAPDQSPSSTKEVLSQFTSLQTQLFEAVAELQEILDLQDARQKVSREIHSKDSALLAFAHKLREAEQVLDALVDDYSDYRRTEDGSSFTTVASQLNLSDIISYAHRISYTTFAPPEFGAGQAPLRGALPPAPQEEQMRASQLYNFADLDVGLPKTDESKEKMIEPSLGPDTNNHPLAGLIPPNITVPSDWVPGMPVELPTDIRIPVMPPGWKPGDPVPLPPLESLHRADDSQLRPGAPQGGFRKEPEVIQVRHVDLDLPDAYGDTSDSDSYEGSTEEED